MHCKARIEVAASVPDISLDQFIAAVAAVKFMELQGVDALVAPSFEDTAPFSAYVPELDLTLVARAGEILPDISADEIARSYGLRLLEDSFLRPFCADFLAGSESPTRGELEREYRTLNQLVLPACTEYRSNLELFGRKQYAFHERADGLVTFMSDLIDGRLSAKNNEEAVFELLRELESRSLGR